MFEAFFELYYREIYLENKKRESKEARKNLTTWLVLVGLFGLAFCVLYALVRGEEYVAVTLWVMMVLILFLWIVTQGEDRWEEIKSGRLKKKNEENMESLQNLLKENKYDSPAYVECMIENCKLTVQEDKWQKVKRICSSVWRCMKKVLHLIFIVAIFLLLEDFGISKEETTLINRLISALEKIFGAKGTIIITILVGLFIISVVAMASIIFEDIIPEVANKRKEAQKVLLRDLYFLKAELLPK